MPSAVVGGEVDPQAGELAVEEPVDEEDLRDDVRHPEELRQQVHGGVAVPVAQAGRQLLADGLGLVGGHLGHAQDVAVCVLLLVLVLLVFVIFLVVFALCQRQNGVGPSVLPPPPQVAGQAERQSLHTHTKVYPWLDSNNTMVVKNFIFEKKLYDSMGNQFEKFE